MIVLSDRRCGRPAKGALYAISRRSVFGALKPFTAVAAPLPAEIANVRRPEIVDVTRTLTNVAGLVHPDPHVNWGRFARLPRIGLADYWGQSQGYRSTWDVIEETQAMGVCRRVANVPSVPLPCPILMMHSEACMDAGWVVVEGWLKEHGIGWASGHLESHIEGLVRNTAIMEDQPWREVGSLGRKGDDGFMWHPYVALWRIVPQLRGRRLFSRFVRECGVRFEEAIFGLSWITDFAWCLRGNEDEVPVHLAVKGVVPACTEDDPRALSPFGDG